VVAVAVAWPVQRYAAAVVLQAAASPVQPYVGVELTAAYPVQPYAAGV
jgi:hypothetical protein